ncbi:MAG: L-threonylcarbamoyladenylate synthase [Burkholderiaceae bacterium]
MPVQDGYAEASIRECASALRAGELVAFPTETVYGLGADAASDAAVGKIFAAKGRPSAHPLIVHVDDAHQGADGVARFARAVPAFAAGLMRAFWPGPLTVILPRQPQVASAAAGGQDSIGLRCPAHPVALALLRACRELGVMGLAGPSANQFGRVSPTTAAHVRDEFGEALRVLDGGPCQVGIESTIVDCTRPVPVLLRPGGIDLAQLQAACGQRVWLPEQAALELPDMAAPRSSGTLEAHYAPRAKVRLMDAKALQTALNVLGPGPQGEDPVIAIYARAQLRCRASAVLQRRMPDDAVATAQQLFAVLRDFDARGVKLIWVETPPAAVEWDGVRDRLRRAAAS